MSSNWYKYIIICGWQRRESWWKWRWWKKSRESCSLSESTGWLWLVLYVLCWHSDQWYPHVESLFVKNEFIVSPSSHFLSLSLPNSIPFRSFLISLHFVPSLVLNLHSYYHIIALLISFLLIKFIFFLLFLLKFIFFILDSTTGIICSYLLNFKIMFFLFPVLVLFFISIYALQIYFVHNIHQCLIIFIFILFKIVLLTIKMNYLHYHLFK